MLLFYVNTIPFMEAIFLLTRFSQKADLNCSPAMVSLLSSHISDRFTAALRFSPQYFAFFPFDRNYKCCIYVDAFYRILFNMLCRGYSRLVLDFDDDLQDDRCLLVFRSLMRPEPLLSGLVLLPSEGKVGGEIDYRYFFSIEAEKFREIVTELHVYYDTIYVTMTDSQVKFSVGADEIVLLKEEDQCLIGRIGAEEETHFQIYLNPIRFFYHVPRRSKRVWFFKSLDSCTIIAAPVGLYGQIWIHFPHDYE